MKRFDVEYFLQSKDFDISKFETLENIVEVRGGKRIPKGMTFSNVFTGYKYLRVEDINEKGEIDFDKLKNINEEVYNTIKNYYIEKDDLCISNAGTIGKISLIKEDYDKKLILTENCAKLIIKDYLKVLPRFLEIILNTDLVQNQFKADFSQATIAKLSLERLKKTKIPLPSLEIQNQIVEKMDFALNEKKRKEKEAKELLESIDDFVLSELGIEYKEVEEKKVFGLSLSELGETKRLDPFFNNPKNLQFYHEINKHERLGESIGLRFGSPYSSNDFDTGNIPLLRIREIRRNFLDVESAVKIKEIPENYRDSIPQKDDIMIGMDGDEFRAAIYEDKYGLIAINQRVAILKPLKNTNSFYLQYVINSSIGIKQFDLARTVAGVVGHISGGDIKDLKIPLPPLEIQNKIADEVSSRIEKAKVLESEAREVYEKAKKEVEGMILD